MRALSLVVLPTLFALVSCRGETKSELKPGADSGPKKPTVDADPGSFVTIYEVQSDDMPEGTAVNLQSVVVTAVDRFGDKTKAIYVQEEAGGPFSGILVYVEAAVYEGIEPGDLVNVVGGEKYEYFASRDANGSLTEVKPPDGGTVTITKVGTASSPVIPEVLNSQDLAADDAEAEKWEGVLVTFSNVRASGWTNDSKGEMRISGPYVARNTLMDLSKSMNEGDCFASITGIADYYREYQILPRTTADLVAGNSEDCTPPEQGEELCADAIDNDHDGLMDCADVDCQETAVCNSDTTVVSAQKGEVLLNSSIRLTDVIVTAVSKDRKKFWVQDAGGAAAYNGLYVFRPSSADELDQAIDIGSKVTLEGTIVLYKDNLSELTNVEIESFEAGTPEAVSVLEGIALADLRDDRSYEGVVVRLSNVSVVDASDPDCTRNCNFSIGTAENKLYINDDIERHNAPAGTCYGAFTGVMHYDTYSENDRPVLLPRVGDLVEGCDD